MHRFLGLLTDIIGDPFITLGLYGLNAFLSIALSFFFGEVFLCYLYKFVLQSCKILPFNTRGDTFHHDRFFLTRAGHGLLGVGGSATGTGGSELRFLECLLRLFVVGVTRNGIEIHNFDDETTLSFLFWLDRILHKVHDRSLLRV